ncbi:TM2 domain-containing protein [Bartonella sp. CB175]|uniref:TM2 domain-containing protein n=1 Tax=Bartonella sp. CB175 TaxID=3112256 RepID=UPI00300E0539
MRGIIINQNQGIYLISGDDGKRYQFALLDWLGKVTPKVGESVDFVCNDGIASSVFPLIRQQPEQLKVMFALLCWCTGLFGVHRFMVGKIWTGALMLILSISFVGLLISGVWMFVDFILILAGQFSDKNGNKITN